MTEKKKAPKLPLEAGGEIDAWCTRCRMDLAHRIVAMVTSTPKRVMCMTCDSEHNFRAPKGEDGAKKKTKARTSATPKLTKKAIEAASILADWEQRVNSGASLTPYTIHESFVEDELVEHKKFGKGFVTAILRGKITVAFADGERTLVHGFPQ